MTIYKLLAVGLGGFLGTIMRYITVKTVDERIQSIFPYGTFIVNIVGSLLLGIIYSLAIRKLGITENWKLFLGGGFCGGFTTFSAFAWENFNLLEHRMGLSILYIAGTVGLGIVAVLLGVIVGKNL